MVLATCLLDMRLHLLQQSLLLGVLGIRPLLVVGLRHVWGEQKALVPSVLQGEALTSLA